MAHGRAGTGLFLTGELRNASLTNAPLGKPSQQPCPCTNRRIGRQTGYNRIGVEWPSREACKELAAEGEHRALFDFFRSEGRRHLPPHPISTTCITCIQDESLVHFSSTLRERNARLAGGGREYMTGAKHPFITVAKASAGFENFQRYGSTIHNLQTPDRLADWSHSLPTCYCHGIMGTSPNPNTYLI